MSSIGSFSNQSYLQGQDPLSIALKNSGVSADALKTVSSDINSVFQSQSGSGSSPPDRTSIRSAINAKLSSDVSSGTLSSADATKITSALDKLDQQFQSGGGQRTGQAGGPPPGGPPPGGPPPGGPPPGGQSHGKSSGSSNSSSSTADSVAKQLIDLINSNSDSSSDTSSSNSSTSSSSTSTTLESYLKKLLSQNFVDTSA